MSFRIKIAAVVLGSVAVATVSAQSPATVQVAGDVGHQVAVFENSLRAAVVRAGNQLAERARQVSRGIALQFESDPFARGHVLPDGEGFLFMVEVPGIEPFSQVSLELATILARPDTGPLRVATPPKPGTVAAPIAAPDPIKAGAATMTDAGAEYTKFAHDALVDCILDNALALPIRERQKLTLIVGDGTLLKPVGLSLAEPRRQLYLWIQGEDLLALRQNKITRAQAKERIKESRH